MTRRLFLGWLGGLAAILFMLPQASRADVYIKQSQHVDAMTVMGQTQPAQDFVSETWMTPTKMVANSEKNKIIIDMQEKSVTFANHEQKTIMSMPLDFTKMMQEQSSKMSEEDKAEMQELMGRMMNINVSVEPTSDQKKIGQWDCKKYIMTMEMGMGTVTSEIWASTDINIDEELYAKFNTAMLAQMPGVSQNAASITQEMKKIKGMHVLTEQKTEMMGQTFNSSVKLLDVKEGKAPADAFGMPTDYKTQSMY